MAEPFEDFLVRLAEKNDFSVLDRIDPYMDGHLAETGNVVAERQRVAVVFRDKAPDTELSRRMLDRIIKSERA